MYNHRFPGQVLEKRLNEEKKYLTSNFNQIFTYVQTCYNLQFKSQTVFPIPRGEKQESIIHIKINK